MAGNTKYLGTVEVTQDDINNGDVNGQSCPIALALKRTFYDDMSYPTSSIELWVPQPKYESEFKVKYQRLRMPRSVKRFITKFDGVCVTPQRDKVKPFKFKAEVVV